MNCHICSSISGVFAQAKILGKHTIQYFRCSTCGFIQTETPYWLDEAYSKAISDIDLGVVNRAITCARFTQFLLLKGYDVRRPYIDYGGGYGMFTRLMRDLGFDFYRYDTYCQNTLAIGFDAEPVPNKQYELLTAFEVFEHLSEPIRDIEHMLSYADNLLFTTELVPAHLPKPGEWWYYSLPSGQHIAFYTYEALAVIARRYSLNLYSNGSSLHVLSKKPLSPRLFKLLPHHKLTALATWWLRRTLPQQSLLSSDFERATGFKL